MRPLGMLFIALSMSLSACGSGGSQSSNQPTEPPNQNLPTEQPSYSNPVRNSESDTALLGADEDNNGVRDDVDTYITTLASDQNEANLMTGFARETIESLLAVELGREEVYQENVQFESVMDCMFVDLPLARVAEITQKIETAILNNELRLRAYAQLHQMLGGTVSSSGVNTGDICDRALIPGGAE